MVLSSTKRASDKGLMREAWPWEGGRQRPTTSPAIFSGGRLWYVKGRERKGGGGNGVDRYIYTRGESI